MSAQQQPVANGHSRGKQCSGFPVAEGNLEYNVVDEQGAIRSYVDKGILKHIEYRLQEMLELFPILVIPIWKTRRYLIKFCKNGCV
ncbi:MAG: hypothetical protein KME29_02750 [Calothrix sp. FI2-JRJ7]|jgi:hypothetical protein|nr:hypothetical protein [Calothrix sp. FI2-JRJ7]